MAVGSLRPGIAQPPHYPLTVRRRQPTVNHPPQSDPHDLVLSRRSRSPVERSREPPCEPLPTAVAGIPGIRRPLFSAEEVATCGHGFLEKSREIVSAPAAASSQETGGGEEVIASPRPETQPMMRKEIRHEPGKPNPRILTRTAVSLLAVFLMAGTALAIDQPPQEPQQQRAWLVGHLVTDMEALGTFDGNTLAKVPGIVNALTDDQVALLAQYYFLTRSKTEQDASLYAMQQQGYADEQVNEAKAEIADLLTAMNDQIEACYAQFVPMPSRSSTSPRSATPACRAGAAMPGATSPNGTTTTAASSVPASTPPTRVRGRCRSATPTTTTAAISTRPTTTSPRPSTSTAASAWRSAMPTGCGTTATGTRRWRTTGFLHLQYGSHRH